MQTALEKLKMYTKNFVGDVEGKEKLGKPRHRWEDTKNVDLKGTECD